MSNLRINFIDNWEKKDVNLEELTRSLEDGNSSVYTDASFKKVSGKWKKFKERGVSNLYLIKELDDDGVACAYYAYSITDGVIDDETLERIREICAQKLSSGEMRADGSFSKPDEWWDTHPLRSIKAVESGSADSLHQYLSAELYPKGIVLDTRSIKAKHANELACSAVAWGVSTSLFKKGAYMSVLIHNDLL
ncbi:hypothetical protein HMPREF9630_00064 [Peptoanaerobacter stomatis]|jgi:hypothetical protein|uniref:Uncharacterized protein n=1 Tax=Peptoanaerobacter stomatis TaxID=796937 RepID=J5WRZ7_9FIRM|nr:hypothetical protein [Peptoanaerobacter stomatis]EHL18339.1 hypothetical protein HMPREF9630_00064 [Peptoanaerobacter stomatis]EJU23972.1 hypothetical protein HMPREF1143_1369 [Peptoanaerobacter stomatis]NWO24216.1 hypothetical protein [Peptostreptococcaceae bacterium oral taxon 081]